jgi:hypothetical protein
MSFILPRRLTQPAPAANKPVVCEKSGQRAQKTTGPGFAPRPVSQAQVLCRAIAGVAGFVARLDDRLVRALRVPEESEWAAALAATLIPMGSSSFR